MNSKTQPPYQCHPNMLCFIYCTDHVLSQIQMSFTGSQCNFTCLFITPLAIY